MVMVFKDCAVASCYYYYQLSTALQKIIGYRIGYYVGNVSEALVDDSMDADKEIDVNGVKRTSEVADRKRWTMMEIRKADQLRSYRLELYVYRVKHNLDVFTGEKIEDKEN